jgi:signal transduction histidine kinase
MQGARKADIQILIVEDESIIAEYIKECLENSGSGVSTVTSSGEEAIKKATENSPDLVLIDTSLKGNINGIEAAENIWNSLQIPVVYFNRHSDKNGVIVYLPDRRKPISENGIEILLDASAAPIKADTGEITGAVLVFRDISNRKQVQESQLWLERIKQLEAQITELQRINHLKDDFLSTVAHELRTPLANITTAIQMLEIVVEQQGGLFSKQDMESTPMARYLQLLRDQCEQELNLLNDLLDLQRLDADTRPLNLTVIDLQNWILHVLETYQERAETNKQSLQVNISPDLPPIVTDSSSLTRILKELLHNACKYTPSGEQIAVTAYAHYSTIQLQVSNSGIEIPKDELPRIFEKFYRIPNTDTWKQGGSGLGLALVKKLVERLGGQIAVDSQAGQTTFTVDLPQETRE